MHNTWLMGIDLGGSGVRCTLVDSASGVRIHTASALHFPTAPGTFGTGVDIDLSRAWAAVGDACREALAEAGTDTVAGIAVAAMRFTSVCLDGDGEVLLAASNADARAAGECFEVSDRWGEQLLATNGAWPLPLHAHARLLNLRNNRSEAFARLACHYGFGDWLNEQLCGVRATDPSQASCTGLFALSGRGWCDDLIEAMDLPRPAFPGVIPAGTVLGGLTDTAAAHLGLPPGTPVAMGGGDTQAALLGAGVIDDGAVAVVAGTTAPVQQVSGEAAVDTSGAMAAAHHILPGRWVLESHCGAMGDSITTMARLFFGDDRQGELRLLAEAQQAPSGAAGMLSTLGAQVMNMRAPGVPVGQVSLSHMTLAGGDAPRSHMARALVEGCACAVRANLALLRERLGKQGQVSLVGGLSRSGFFGQLLADMTGADIATPAHHNTTGLGAALCAAVGAGIFADFASACAGLCKTSQHHEPDKALREANERLYTTWDRFRRACAGSTGDIAAEHVLPHLLKEPEDAGAAFHAGASALVSAAFDASSLARLREHMDVEYASFREVHRLLTGPDLVQALAGKQVLVTEVDVVDANALQQLPDLRVIAACRGDAVNVDVEACTAFGIPVLSAPGRNAVAVADLTVGFILNLARKLPAATQFLKQPDVTAGNMGKMGQAFSQLQGRELWRKTVGLVGLGAVGRAVAARLAGFDAEILVADPFVTPEQAALAGARLVDLDTLLASSDFVSLHAAVTADTTGMIGAAQFARMKPGAFFVNTARAALVDEQPLVDALQSGHLGGAALDTFAVEPPGFDHPLVQMDTVISTPHAAGNTVEVAHHQGESVSEALLQLLRGEKPRCVLNPQTLENFSWTGNRPVPSEAQLAALRDKGGPAVSDLQRDAGGAKTAGSKDPAAAATAAPQAIVDRMRTILEQFCAGMAADAELAKFSADKEVTLQFTVLDLGLAFFISLQRGQLVSALGAPEHNAQVQLEMRGEILDGMFTGTIDTMECAMNGEISFMGDAAKAMTLQHMSADMERLYKSARKTVGDPGDLAAVPRPGSAVAAAPADMATGDIREDLVDTMMELYASQVITATGGNISTRIPGTGDEIWITPSRLFKGDLKPDVMVRINLGGESLDPGSRSPSSEWAMHTRILEVKPEAQAVIHAHAPNATILANAGLPFLPISTEAAFFGDIPRIPFIMPGTGELAEAVAEAMDDEWAALMVNHGIIVAGRSLRRAADMVEIIERTAEVILGCYAVGREPPVLPPEDAAHFRKLGDIVA